MSRVILITGGNRGIGLAIAQSLLEREPRLEVIIGCRNVKSGAEAVESLLQSGWKASFVELDVSSDESITRAAATISTTHGRVDTLINNAGLGLVAKEDNSDLRRVFHEVLDINVVSVAMMMETFAPLLSKSSDPRIINISSARGSLTRNACGALPPTVSIPYTVSKASLNLLGIEFAKFHNDILVQTASPGHCRTAFNGYRGTKEPADGAKVVVALALDPREEHANMGFWEIEGASARPTLVPW